MYKATSVALALALAACSSDPAGIDCGTEIDPAVLAAAQQDTASGSWEERLRELTAAAPPDSVVGIAVNVGGATRGEVEAALLEAGGTDIYWFHTIPVVTVYLPAGKAWDVASEDWVYHVSVITPGTEDATRGGICSAKA